MHIKWQKFNTEMKYTTDTLTMSYMSYLTGHSSCQITYVAPLPGVTAPARSLLLCRLSTDCSCLQGTSTSSGSCRVDICSSVVFHRLQGQNLLHYWPAGESLLQYVEHLLLLLFWLSDLLASTKFFFSHIFLTAVSQLPHRGVFFFFFNPLLSYAEEQTAFFIVSALDSSGYLLEPAGTGSIRHRAALGLFSNRPPLQQPPSLPAPTISILWFGNERRSLWHNTEFTGAFKISLNKWQCILEKVLPCCCHSLFAN